MATMLPIMTKLNVILRSFFRHRLGKELKAMATLPLKNIFHSAITHFKVALIKTLLINRDRPSLITYKQSLTFELGDN